MRSLVNAFLCDYTACSMSTCDTDSFSKKTADHPLSIRCPIQRNEWFLVLQYSHLMYFFFSSFLTAKNIGAEQTFLNDWIYIDNAEKKKTK